LNRRNSPLNSRAKISDGSGRRFFIVCGKICARNSIRYDHLKQSSGRDGSVAPDNLEYHGVLWRSSLFQLASIDLKRWTIIFRLSSRERSRTPLQESSPRSRIRDSRRGGMIRHINACRYFVCAGDGDSVSIMRQSATAPCRH
jgi:hypothetical protein